MQFKVWLEEKELFQDIKKKLRDEILATLDPNQDFHHVMATRLSAYKDKEGIHSGALQVANVFDKNPKIWSMMNKAFPAEVNKANQIRNWLKTAGDTDTIGDLFQQIGIYGEPIVTHKKIDYTKMPSPHQNKSPEIKQIQQPPQQAQMPSQGQVPSPFNI